MFKSIILSLALVLGGFGVAKAADVHEVGEILAAVVVCESQESIHELVTMYNEGHNDEANDRVLNDPDFSCWSPLSQNFPFVPVTVTKVLDTVGKRTIYEGQIDGVEHPVYVFSVSVHGEQI